MRGRVFTGLVLAICLLALAGCGGRKAKCMDQGDWGACVETCDVDKDQGACAKLKLIGMEACTKGDKEICRKLCDYYKVEPACALQAK